MIEAQLPIIRHVVDFGLVVLICLVQWIIYPSFRFTAKNELVGWHQRYVGRITAVVAPLMITQGLVVAAELYLEPSWIHALAMVLVVLCWLCSFGLSIPLHRKIDQGQGSDEVLKRLVYTNWPRTIFWTLVFILGIVSSAF